MSGHEELMELLHAIQADVKETRDGVKLQNGRVRKLEAEAAVMRWIVMSGGAGVISALGWLIVKHMAV